jgi:hypothetical protein
MFGFNRPFISGRTPVSDPRNPAYDDSRDDAICDEAIEGSLSMRHCPTNLLLALADWLDAGDTHEDAVRELLMPLYAERQSLAMKAMHAEFSRSDEAAGVAELALEREFSR